MFRHSVAWLEIKLLLKEVFFALVAMRSWCRKDATGRVVKFCSGVEDGFSWTVNISGCLVSRQRRFVGSLSRVPRLLNRRRCRFVD